jgi:hypothetical protein
VSGTGPAKILNVSSEAVYYSPRHFTDVPPPLELKNIIGP